MYLNKLKTVAQPRVWDFSSAVKRKHQTFLKNRLLQIKGKITVDQNIELVDGFREVVRILFAVDRSTIIYTWNKNSRINSIRGKVTAPNNRDAIGLYMERLFVQHGRYTYIRVLVGHNSARLKFKTAQVQTNFMSNEMTIVVDKLQCKITAAMGWMLGMDSKIWDWDDWGR